MEIQRLTVSEWDEELPETGRYVFHQSELLTVLAEHSSADELVLYGGRKGDRLVGMLPVFVNRNWLGIRTVSSPPPGMHVPYLGPVLMSASPKARKRERVNNRFTRGVLEDLDLDSRSLVFIVCSPRYKDPRPYQWGDMGLETFFTYEVPIDGRTPEDLMSDLSKSRRREIRNAKELDVRVERGDIEDANRVYKQTSERFADQNEYYGMDWEFVRDVITAPSARVRVYVTRAPDGEFLSGIIVLYSSEAALFWLGGVRTDYENVSMNSLLHWNIIRDIAEDTELEEVGAYDMVGAGEYRLSKFKAKFGPELRPYYVANSGGAKMRAAKFAYRLLESSRERFPI